MLQSIELSLVFNYHNRKLLRRRRFFYNNNHGVGGCLKDGKFAKINEGVDLLRSEELTQVFAIPCTLKFIGTYISKNSIVTKQRKGFFIKEAVNIAPRNIGLESPLPFGLHKSTSKFFHRDVGRIGNDNIKCFDPKHPRWIEPFGRFIPERI